LYFRDFGVGVDMGPRIGELGIDIGPRQGEEGPREGDDPGVAVEQVSLAADFE
jgi:hypothetical protein